MTGGHAETADVTWSDVAGRLEAFLAAWERTAEPDIAAHLPAGPAPRRRLVLVELVKVDLDCRAGAGRPRRLEEYVTAHPELQSAEGPPVELICEECHVRRSRGEQVDIEELCGRFPGRARELRNWLGGIELTRSTSLVTDQVGGRCRPGDTLDDFLLLDELGRGAFATVFLARQVSMGRMVALKVSADRGDEARTLAQLDHPHIVRVFDQKRLEPAGGVPAMRLVYEQYLPGGTLAAVVERVRRTTARDRSGAILAAAVRDAAGGSGFGLAAESPALADLPRLSWPAVVARLGVQLADALDHAHAAGILHRDMKPANVLLAADGTACLGDFNTSSLATHPTNGPAAYFGGSLAYMSPEHLEAFDARHARSPAELDGRSDVYSLAVLLWELLAGRRPFSDPPPAGGGVGSVLEEMVARRRRAEIDPAAFPADPAARPLVDMLEAALAAEPDKRPASAATFARRLALVLQPEAMKLLAPQRTGWRAFARRRPFTAAAACILLPNVILGACNFVFNHRLLLALYAAPDLLTGLPAFDAAFLRVAVVVNVVSFPAGLLLIRHFTRAAADLLERDRRGMMAAVPAERVGAVRRRLLVLGDMAAWIGVAMWMASGLAFPLGIALQVGPLPAEVLWLFMQSPVACGLIAAAYPFFLTTLLVLRVFYPALLRPEDEPRTLGADEEALRRLASRSGFYLLVAAGVPLVTLAMLIVIHAAMDRGWLALLTLAGLLGLAFATWARHVIEADVAALIAAGRPLESLRADSWIAGTR